MDSFRTIGFIALLTLVASVAGGTEIVTDGEGHWAAVWVRGDNYMYALSSDDANTWTKPESAGTAPSEFQRTYTGEQIPVDNVLKAVVPKEWNTPLRAANRNDRLVDCNGVTVSVLRANEGFAITTKDNATGEDHVWFTDNAWCFPCVTTDGAGNWLVIWGWEDVMFSSSHDNGKTWSGALAMGRVGKDGRSVNPYGPKAIMIGENTWCVTWGEGEFDRGDGDGPSSELSTLWSAVSTDSGKTWSSPVELTKGIQNNNDSISNLSIVRTKQRVHIAWSQKVPDEKGVPPQSDIVLVSSEDGLTWTPPRIINGNSRNRSGMNTDPVLSVDQKGLLLCAWHSTDSLGRTIGRGDHLFMARSSDDAKTWSFPIALDFEGAASIDPDTYAGWNEAPCIATNDEGRWVIVWESDSLYAETLGIDADILTCYSDDFGKTWSQAAPLNTDAPTDYADDRKPCIACDENGHWVTAWLVGPTEFDGWSRSCRAASSTDGKTWSNPVDVPTLENRGETVKNMRLTSLGTGKWLITHIQDTYHYRPSRVVCVRSEDDGKTWAGTTKLSSSSDASRQDDDYALTPMTARLADGTCLAMWWARVPTASGKGQEEGLFFRISRDGGATWSPAEKLSVENTWEETCELHLSADMTGKVLATWWGRRTTGRKGGVYLASTSADGGKTWSQVREVCLTGSPECGATLASDGRGRYIYLSQDNFVDHSTETPQMELRVVTSDDGMTWSAPEVLAVTHNPSSYWNAPPSLATDGKGKWMAAYESREKTDGDKEDCSIYLLKSWDNGDTWSLAAPVGCTLPDQKDFLVQEIGGLSVGPQRNGKYMEEKDVISKYGEGLYMSEEDHCGGRYYTNRKHSVTLHCTFGTDRFLDFLELTRGSALPFVVNWSDAECNALNEEPEIGQGLKLGMSVDELLRTFRKPEKDVQDAEKRDIEYESDSKKDPRVGLNYKATLTFRKGVLERIQLYDGE